MEQDVNIVKMTFITERTIAEKNTDSVKDFIEKSNINSVYSPTVAANGCVL